MKSKYVKFGILGVIIIAAIIVLFTTDILSYLNPDAISAFIKQFGIWAPLVYGIIYMVGILLLVPATIFTVAAGALFGTLQGTIIVVVAATTAASIAFLIGRLFGKDVVKKMAGGTHVGPWIQKLDDLIGKHQFQSMVLMRLLFLPYIHISYAAGMIPKASFWAFTWATLLTNILISTMFVYLGDNLTQGPRALILPVILVVLVLLIPKVVKKFAKKKIPE